MVSDKDRPTSLWDVDAWSLQIKGMEPPSVAPDHPIEVLYPWKIWTAPQPPADEPDPLPELENCIAIESARHLTEVVKQQIGELLGNCRALLENGWDVMTEDDKPVAVAQLSWFLRLEAVLNAFDNTAQSVEGVDNVQQAGTMKTADGRTVDYVITKP